MKVNTFSVRNRKSSELAGVGMTSMGLMGHLVHSEGLVFLQHHFNNEGIRLDCRIGAKDFKRTQSEGKIFIKKSISQKTFEPS